MFAVFHGLGMFVADLFKLRWHWVVGKLATVKINIAAVMSTNIEHAPWKRCTQT